MNLRFPAVAAAIVAAAAAAAFHAFHHDAPSPAAVDSFADATPRALPSIAPARRPEPRVTVYVAGAVARSGVYALGARSRVVDALHAAGGPRRDADLVAVNLARALEDGEEIVVPVVGADPVAASAAGRGDERATPVRTAHRGKHRRRGRKHRHAAPSASGDAAATEDAPSTASEAGASAADSPTETVDLNHADENELETLPGIGASLASRIVNFREINGPFASPDDLLDVGGMTQGRLDAIAPYVSTR